jgi:hypothetical protein
MPDWKDTQPDEIKNDPNFASFKGETLEQVFPEIAKSFGSAQKMIGSRIPIPTKPEELPEWNKAHREKLVKAGIIGEGAPETPDKYTLPDSGKEVFGALKLDTLLKDKILPGFHKLGIPRAQAEGVLGLYAEVLTDVENARTVNHNTSVETLKKEWGVEYDAKTAKAVRAVRSLGGEELTERLDETGWGDDPVLIRIFSRIGDMIGEDGFIKGGQVTFDSTIDAAKAKIAEMANDPKHPLWDENHPAHKAAVAEQTRLFQIANPK